MNWEHVTDKSDDGEDIELEQLPTGPFGNLEVIQESDGRYYACFDNAEAEGWIDLGQADTLDAAKQLAEKWALDQIGEMLKALGGGYCISSANSVRQQ